VWQTEGAAFFHKEKVVMVPKAVDRKGVLYHTHPIVDRSWIIELEANIGNEENTWRGGTGLAVFFLRSVDKGAFKEGIFGYSNRYDGLAVFMNTILSQANGRQMTHPIQGVINDGGRIVNVF